MTNIIKFRHSTTAEWAAANSILASGEPGVDITTGDFKIGDGSTTWSSTPLKYAPSSLSTSAPRGVVAVGVAIDGVTLSASNVDLTNSLSYTFDPTRRYRINYTIRALIGLTTLQFSLVNNGTGAAVSADQLTAASNASLYGGASFTWLFTYNGFLDMRVRTTTFYTASAIVYGRDFYIEDVGAV